MIQYKWEYLNNNLFLATNTKNHLSTKCEIFTNYLLFNIKMRNYTCIKTPFWYCEGIVINTVVVVTVKISLSRKWSLGFRQILSKIIENYNHNLQLGFIATCVDFLFPVGYLGFLFVIVWHSFLLGITLPCSYFQSWRHDVMIWLNNSIMTLFLASNMTPNVTCTVVSYLESNYVITSKY